MSQDRNGKSVVNGAAKDLEPYRRLVELQKQMIELAQKHDQTKRRRDALSELVTREAVARRPGRSGLRHRFQRSAARLLKRVSKLTLEKTVPATHHKRTLP